jgi:hypothetical protein
MTAAPDLDGTRLNVSYDGPEVATGRMDLRLLANAMASVAQLVDDAARISYGTDAGIRIEVSGDFRRGSFSYQIVATALAELQAHQVKEILEYLGLITGFTGLTVVGVLKWLRGRKPDKVQKEGNQARISAGRQSQIVNLQVAQLVVNQSIRADFEGMTQPLERPGITVMRTSGEAAEPPMEITRDEREAFLAPPPIAEQLDAGESRPILQLVSPNFRIGNKWQFAYPGEAPFFAPILDKDFLIKLQRREVSFSFGDLIRVRLRTVVNRTDAGTLSTVREILEILDKLEPPKQWNLFTDLEEE